MIGDIKTTEETLQINDINIDEAYQPGAEKWQADTRWSRTALVEEIRAEWLRILGDEALFPWHDDFVIHMFVTLRKAQKPVKVALCEELNIEVPQQWTSGESD